MTNFLGGIRPSTDTAYSSGGSFWGVFPLGRESSHVANTDYFKSIYIPQAVTFDAFQYLTGSTNTGTLEFGLLDNSGNLLGSSSYTADGTSAFGVIQDATAAANISITQPGTYWLVVNTSAANMVGTDDVLFGNTVTSQAVWYSAQVSQVSLTGPPLIPRDYAANDFTTSMLIFGARTISRTHSAIPATTDLSTLVGGGRRAVAIGMRIA